MQESLAEFYQLSEAHVKSSLKVLAQNGFFENLAAWEGAVFMQRLLAETEDPETFYKELSQFRARRDWLIALQQQIVGVVEKENPNAV